ncbi:hypothetical protein ACE6H2_006534 [Prunus campanulata]
MTTQPVSSSSSSSSSSFTHDSSWTYDVFLSFRGEDTRTNFTDHLYKALCDKGIYTFIDRELTRGEEISPALVKAIEESRISLIVFSENYASSRWCLDELVNILQCKQSNQQVVLPIFYKLDPSDVRKQTSKFGDAFEGLIESKFKDDKQIQGWRKALTEAANLSGWHFEDGAYEATFINNIVDGILSQLLSRTYLNVAKYPVGIQSRVQNVERLLDVGGNGCRMVGIWGKSGIGKTTIAKAIFNAVSHKFGGSCFLENVREGSLVQLQKTLLQEILGGKKLEIASTDKGISIIHKLLRHKKILLILDDVNQLEQLDNLAGVGWFGEGSRVIITTQDSGLLKCHGIELIYEVPKLFYYQALELFSLNAFGINEPPDDYLELAKRAITYAQGLPLAITLLGSHLRNKGIHRWQAILDGFKGEPYADIGRILQKSYDSLDDYTKEAFLDIACFFKGEFKDYVLGIVPKNYIEVLVDKAMITIEWDDRILMHDLLANLGKDIVHKESPNDPGQRSRLWFYEDVKRVLTENKAGTRNIKGIMVKLPKPAEIILNPKCFCNMVNLEIFINRNASLCGHINYLPNALRFIDWPSCQLQSLPSEFHPEHLVVFNMPSGCIRRLKKLKNMPQLTSMNLRGCQFLEKIPDLSGIPNIKYLILRECTSLVEIDDSVGLLDKLVELDLKGCVTLTRFATRLRLKSLEKLCLSDCKRLESFPEIEVEMQSLRKLDITRSGVRELPSSIAYLTGLRSLVAVSSELQLLPNLLPLNHLPNLTHMDLSDCQSLEKIPDLSGIPYIKDLNLSGCTSLVEVDDSIGLLDKLVILILSGCVKLTRFGTRLRLKSLRLLYLRNCKRLESFPEIEVEMESLRTLNMGGSGIRELPLSISYLTGLQSLDLSGCFNLTGLLYCWSTLRYLKLAGINFVTLPECISKFVSLEQLDLRDCKSLLEIPQEVLPPRVRSVFLDNCTSLKTIPKLPLSSADENRVLTLTNCARLRGYDITEKSILDQVSSHPHSQFKITLPGDEVPKWFSCCKDATLVQDEFVTARCEVCFEIPPNFDWETLRLVLCVVNKENSYLINGRSSVHINRTRVQSIYMHAVETHVALSCIPLLSKSRVGEESTRLQQGNMCQIIFELWEVPRTVKILYGVHLLGHQVADVTVDSGQRQWLLPDAMAVDDYIHDDQHQDNELLSLPSASETSLGKRPRLSDFMALDDDHRANVVDVGNHEAQRGEADHPKRRHTDLNEEPK